MEVLADQALPVESQDMLWDLIEKIDNFLISDSTRI